MWGEGVTVHRSPFKVGDKITPSRLLEIGGSRATFPKTRRHFTVNDVRNLNYASGGYYIYASNGEVDISFTVMYPRFGRKSNGNKPYFTAFRWLSEDMKKPVAFEKPVPTLNEMDIGLVNKIVPAGQRGKMFLKDFLEA